MTMSYDFFENDMKSFQHVVVEIYGNHIRSCNLVRLDQSEQVLYGVQVIVIPWVVRMYVEIIHEL